MVMTMALKPTLGNAGTTERKRPHAAVVNIEPAQPVNCFIVTLSYTAWHGENNDASKEAAARREIPVQLVHQRPSSVNTVAGKSAAF